MADPNKPNLPREEKKEENGSMRSTHSIHRLADCSTDKTSYVDVTAMIRSLQRTEGLRDCFRRGIADCDQLDCAWRRYCLGGFDTNDK